MSDAVAQQVSFKEHKHRESFVSGIIRENPLFVSMLGLCPALAVTTSFEASLGMGLLFTFVLVCSNVLVSLLRKLIPENIKTPCYIVIIATFVTIVKMLCNAFLPELYSSLGVYLSLLVVNCIVLGRSESFASKNTVLDSLLDGLGNGLGYTIAIVIIGLVREILGTGMFSMGSIFTFIPEFSLPILKATDGSWDYSMSFFSNPAGGFVVLAIILAIMNCWQLHKKNKMKVEAKKAKEAKAAKKEEQKA